MNSFPLLFKLKMLMYLKHGYLLKIPKKLNKLLKKVLTDIVPLKHVKYSLRIAEEMAKELGHHPALIGWQIDNEICIKGAGCFCENCRAGFRKYLEKKYGTIENLNARWNLTLFSQAYERFDQIPAPEHQALGQPGRRAWHNPHLIIEWRIFQEDSHIDFIHEA